MFNQTEVSASKSNIQGSGRKFLEHFIRHLDLDLKCHAILGHKYHQNDPNRVIRSEQTEHFQQKVSFIIFVPFGVRVLLSAANTLSRSSL